MSLSTKGNTQSYALWRGNSEDSHAFCLLTHRLSSFHLFHITIDISSSDSPSFATRHLIRRLLKPTSCSSWQQSLSRFFSRLVLSQSPLQIYSMSTVNYEKMTEQPGCIVLNQDLCYKVRPFSVHLLYWSYQVVPSLPRVSLNWTKALSGIDNFVAI